MQKQSGWLDDLEWYLPEQVVNALRKTDEKILSQVDELRLRAERPLMLTMGSSDSYLMADGTFSRGAQGAMMLSGQDVNTCFGAVNEHSIYAHEEELQNGFITLRGGYRVGLAGRISPHASGRMLTNCAGLSIRICREIKGCANAMISYIWQAQTVQPTLIISPPMMGKTTLLRDMIRQISDGVYGQGGYRVTLIDERGELACCVDGVPQLDVGLRTDVLDSCPKAQGMMMALRALSPQVLATDELGGELDACAVLEAAFAGVSVIATVHGLSVADIEQRPGIGQLIRMRAFSRYILLGGRPGHVAGMWDADLAPIWDIKQCVS